MRGTRMRYLGALSMLWIGSVAAQPHIAIRDNLPFDFGDVVQGARPTHAVTLANEGTDTLIIEHVDSPCHCTSTMLHHATIPPKDSSLLVITFNSSEFIDSVRKYVLVVSNDYARRNLFVNYSAHVVSLLSVIPRQLDFGDVASGERASRSLTLTNVGKDSLRIRNVITPGPYLQSSFSGLTLGAGQETTVVFTLNAFREKPYGEMVQFVLDNSIQPVATIWFSAHVRSKKQIR